MMVRVVIQAVVIIITLHSSYAQLNGSSSGVVPVAFYPLNGHYESEDIGPQRLPRGKAVGVQLAEGPYGNPSGSFYFNGSEDCYVEFENSGPLDTRHSMSILAWIYPEDSGPIFSYRKDWKGMGLEFKAPTIFFARFMRRNLNKAKRLKSSDLRYRTWNFVGATYNGDTGEGTLWLGNRTVKSKNIGTFELATNWTVRMGARDVLYYQGRVACLQVYAEALSSEQIIIAKDRCNNINVTVNGNWSPWSAWSACSKTCGGGEKRQNRSCTNPPPSDGGKTCTGESTKTEACNEEACVGCRDANWLTILDKGPVLASCTSGNEYLRGFWRSARQSDDRLSLLEEAKCCEPPEPYNNNNSLTQCVNADWRGVLNRTKVWALCPNGSFLQGFNKSGGQELSDIVQGKCCSPQAYSGMWGKCYDEDVLASFDKEGWSVCKPGFYLVGFYKSTCNRLYCIEWLKCCEMEENVISVGDRVFGRWTNGLYYKGVIDKVSNDTLHIQFDDGDQVTHKRSDLAAVVLDVIPPKNDVMKGRRVIAFWPNRVRFYLGVVEQIDLSKPKGYFILYDDGGEGWRSLDELRILPNMNGNWSPWSAWSACSKTCGAGEKRQNRSCTNPPPSNGGKKCTGESTKPEACNEEACGALCTCKEVSILINNTKTNSSVLFANSSYDVSVNVSMDCGAGGTPRLSFDCAFAGITWTAQKTVLNMSTLRRLNETSYLIVCRVQYSGLVCSASAAVDIVKPEPIATFTSEYITARGVRSVLLSTISSLEPDGVRCGGLTYTWFCRLHDETFPGVSNVAVDIPNGKQRQPSRGCFGYGPGQLTSKEPNVVIDVNTVEKGQILVFMLSIWKDDRLASTFHSQLLPKTGPELRCVENCGNKVDVTRRTEVAWYCDAPWCQAGLRYDWSLYKMERCALVPVHDLERKISTRIDSASLAFKGKMSWNETSLEENTTYKLSVTSYQGSDIKDISCLILDTNSKPYLPQAQGGCLVRPIEGVALNTSFMFKCVGWLDVDEPLSYTFKYRTNSGAVTFYEGQASNASALMPLGDPNNNFSLVVEMVVQDAFGASESVFTTLKVILPDTLDSLNIDAVDDLLDTKDPVQAIANALVILSVVGAAEINGSSKTKIQVKEKILDRMLNVSAKTLGDVIKLASIVNMTTHVEEEVTPAIEDNSLTILDDMVTFTSQWKNRNDDPGLVKEAGSVVLRCISNVMSLVTNDTMIDISDGGTRTKAINPIKKALEFTDTVGSIILQTMNPGEDSEQFKTKYFDMLLGKHLLSDAGNEIVDGIFLPSARDIFGKESESLVAFGSQLIKFPVNPYNWDASSKDITSSVVDFSLKTNEGSTLDIADLKNPVELRIPRRAADSEPPKGFFAKSQEDKTEIRYHRIFIPSEDVSVSLTITPNGNRSAIIYVSAGQRPTPRNHLFRTVLPNRTFCQNYQVFNCSREAYTFSVSSGMTGATGLHYIGIRPLKGDESVKEPSVRLRRDCGGHNGRRKRSCIGVKDPPTTVPPTTIIIPIYNASTDVNYTMSVSVASCKYWSNKTNKWTSKGCKAGLKSVPDKIQCFCTHLSAFGGNFFVAPNPIDFDVVWARLPDIGKNFSVLATICTIFALYVLCLIYARRADKKDHSKVIAHFFVARDFSDSYQYQIYVRTGIWSGYGTSAKVGIILYGENGCTGNIYLTDSQLRKKFFARASVNHFIICLPESLGQLYKIELWHDDTGKNSSWFVEDVCIVDRQTTDEWHFIARRWLSLVKGDGELKVELRAADEEQLKSIGNLTYTRAAANLADGHLWFSIFTKPPHSKFTRCQRLSCCLSTIFAAMVANAMFYQFGKKAEDSFKVGPLQVSWMQIMIGIQSSVVAVPLNVLLVLIFRNIKEVKGQSYSVATEDERSNLGCLPHFFVYIAWLLCLATAITSTAFVFFYSISWGKEISDQWLTSILVSVFEDILVLQPLKVVLLASLVSVILRKLPQRENIVGPSLWRTRKASEVSVVGAQAEKVAFKDREYKKKVLKTYSTIAELATFLVFIILLMIVCYGNRKETRYMITRSVRETVNAFENVGEPPMFWEWSRRTLVPGLYQVRWYNGQPFGYEEGFISTREAFLIGMPRLRQIRVKPEPKCQVDINVLQETFDRCLPSNMADNEDTTRFQRPGWIPVHNEQEFSSDFEKLCPKPWRYRTANELQTTSFQGQTYSYGGGGYVADLGYTSSSANEVIDDLEKTVWIDDKTAGVFVEFTVFEPSTSLVTSVKYLYERLATGQTNTATKVKTLTLYSPADPQFRSVYEVCQLLFIFVICLMLFGEIVKFARAPTAYFKHFWNWVELIQIISAASSLAMFFLKQQYTSTFVKKVRANPFETSSADYLVMWSDLEIALLSFVIFIVTIKLLQIIRFNRHVCQMMLTLKRSCKPLVSFSAVFITALLGFTHLGYLVFGHNVEAYSTYGSTLHSMLIMTLGGRMYYDKLISVAQVIGPCFLFVYMLIIGLLLVNLFVTILMDTYSDVTGDDSGEDFSDADLGEFMADYIAECIKDLFRKLVLLWDEQKKGERPTRGSAAGFRRKANTIRRKGPRSGTIMPWWNSSEMEGSEDVEPMTVSLEVPFGNNKSVDRLLNFDLRPTWYNIFMMYVEEETVDDESLEEVAKLFLDCRN